MFPMEGVDVDEEHRTMGLNPNDPGAFERDPDDEFKFKVGDRAKIVEAPFDYFDEDAEEMAGDIGRVASVWWEHTVKSYAYELILRGPFGDVPVNLLQRDLVAPQPGDGPRIESHEDEAARLAHPLYLAVREALEDALYRRADVDHVAHNVMEAVIGSGKRKGDKLRIKLGAGW